MMMMVMIMITIMKMTMTMTTHLDKLNKVGRLNRYSTIPP